MNQRHYKFYMGQGKKKSLFKIFNGVTISLCVVHTISSLSVMILNNLLIFVLLGEYPQNPEIFQADIL